MKYRGLIISGTSNSEAQSSVAESEMVTIMLRLSHSMHNSQQYESRTRYMDATRLRTNTLREWK